MTSQYLEIFNQINFNKIIDRPNILIAAYFWDEERYLAAKKCYQLMRTVDDLVDNHKSENEVISEKDKALLKEQIYKWLENLDDDSEENSLEQSELIKTISHFRIPVSILEDFARAMLYDIDQDGFADLQTFIEYSQGASVAPSAIFVHLCGIQYHDGQYGDPAFNVREAAQPCAIFSYLVHIIRDFQKDQFDGLNYLADDLVKKHGLSRNILHQIAEGADIPQGFRNLIREYMGVAEVYRIQTLEAIERITPFLEPRYQLSLHIIYNLYLMVYERIDVEKGKFTNDELNPTAEEIKDRVYQTIVEFSS